MMRDVLVTAAFAAGLACGCGLTVCAFEVRTMIRRLVRHRP